MKCSYRTFQINNNNEVWCVTQDIRRRRNHRTGCRYMGKLSERQIKRYTKQMQIRLVIRLKHWNKPTQAYLKAVSR